MADSELDDLLTDGFDLEIVEAPVINPNVFITESEAVKLGFRLRGARREFRIREVRMRVQHVEFFELLDPTEHAVKGTA